MSYQTQPIPTTSDGVPGSMRYGIDHRRCYDVQGICQYGRIVCDADSHLEAAQIALWKGSDYWVWVPNGTLLKIYRVGPKDDYMRTDLVEYHVWNGQAFPLATDAEIRAAVQGEANA